MRINPVPTLQNPCACLCRQNHPDAMGCCTGRATVIVTTAAGVDIDMCIRCGETWDLGGKGNLVDQLQDLQINDPAAAAEIFAVQDGAIPLEPDLPS